MTKTLKDPSKPAGYVFREDVNEDGSATTNDGRKLKSARKNPWYVLATIYGEHAAGAWPSEWDRDIVSKNRRAWNGWACAEFSEERRAELAKKMELEPADLKPLSESENDAVLKLFRKRMGDETAELPFSEHAIRFAETYFEKPVGFERFVVPGDTYFRSATFSSFADFRSAMFSGLANFWSATFSGLADFRSAMFFGLANFWSAMFSGYAVFRSATFSSLTVFLSATFSGRADFRSATFSGDASFQAATFSGQAYFRSTTFSGRADFGSAKFESVTSFKKAIFETHVPAFFGADLYADTTFEIPGAAMQQRLHWPPFTGGPNKIMPAEAQKRAYNRLRLFMNQSLQTDEEQFFHRREMECKKELALRRGGEGRFMYGVYGLYGLLSNYGHSVGRPLVGLGANVVFGWLVFATVFYAASDALNGVSHTSAFGVSFSNVFAFLGFGRVFLGDFYRTMSVEYGAWLVFLSGAQTVLGFILLFLLGLGLRNRFRLR